jgi:two-component system, chemotaxis family, response regulator WspF
MKIAIVNSAGMVVEAQRQAIARRAAHEVVWIARTAREALSRCSVQLPDVLLLGLDDPDISSAASGRLFDGLGFPIVIVASSVAANAGRVLEAMSGTAIDAVDAPMDAARTTAFLRKLDIVEKLISAWATGGSEDQGGTTGIFAPAPRLVCIGASAGGPAALATVLGALPTDFSAAIVIVQHVDERFAHSLVEWLAQRSRIPVRAATENERPAKGVALVAATDSHLVLNKQERLAYTSEPANAIYRPSVDVFFRSVSAYWRGTAIGVLLTGMGRDGAEGLKALRERGFHTIAQDGATSAVYGMPKAAAAIGAAVEVLPLEGVVPGIVGALRKGSNLIRSENLHV